MLHKASVSLEMASPVLSQEWISCQQHLYLSRYENRAAGGAEGKGADLIVSWTRLALNLAVTY